MVIVDFKVDEEELIESLEPDMSNIDDCIFVSTIFLMPSRMRVNEFELFEFKGQWLPAPIISLASGGLSAVERLKVTRKEKYIIVEGPGDITFRMIDEKKVNLFFKGDVKTVDTVVSYDELLEAFQKFAEKVRKFLWERAPQINNHPYWGPWLRGERD